MPRGPLDPLDAPEDAGSPRTPARACELEVPLSPGSGGWSAGSSPRRPRWARKAWKLQAVAVAVGALVASALVVAAWRAARLRAGRAAEEAFAVSSKAMRGPIVMGNGNLTDAGVEGVAHSVPTSIPTSATRTTTGEPASLCCFVVVRPHAGEEDLLRAQLEAGAGIFACDEAVVFAAPGGKGGRGGGGGSGLLLGKDAAGADVYAQPLELGAAELVPWRDQSAEQVAMALGVLARREPEPTGSIWGHDWLVKVDPQTVFFPDRLRLRLEGRGREKALYLQNCNGAGAEGLEEGRMLGALEVFSRAAVEAFLDGSERCAGETLPLDQGEDAYLQRCMDVLGVQGFRDDTVLSDQRCIYAPCSDGWRAAFHPFREASSWLGCWHWSSQASKID